MLINHDNEVYEIDEKCLKSRKVPKDCEVMEEYRRETQKNLKEKREEHFTNKIFTVNWYCYSIKKGWTVKFLTGHSLFLLDFGIRI